MEARNPSPSPSPSPVRVLICPPLSSSTSTTTTVLLIGATTSFSFYRQHDDSTHLLNRVNDSNIFASGNLDKLLLIEDEEAKEWFKRRRISYFHDRDKGILFRHFTSIVRSWFAFAGIWFCCWRVWVRWFTRNTFHVLCRMISSSLIYNQLCFWVVVEDNFEFFWRLLL